MTRRATAFDRMLSGSVGAPEILMGRSAVPGGGSVLGDPAAAFEGTPAQVQYQPDNYKDADFIVFGISSGVAGGVTIGAGLTVEVTGQVSTPFKPLRLFLPSTLAPGLFVARLSYGAWNLVDGDPIPAEMLSEVSLANAVSYPTAATSQVIRVSLLNATAAPVTHVALGMLGVRLR